jgi:hypothetical protein
VELAWCAFARERDAMRVPVEMREQGVSVASFKAGAEWERGKHLSIAALEKALKHEERTACADLVRAAGCRQDPCEPDGSWHSPNCPIALAERIEAWGRA